MRAQAQRAAIEESIGKESYPVAEQEIRNWAEWLSQIESPTPKSAPGTASVYKQIKDSYPEEPKHGFTPDIPRAEKCEALILALCTNREIKAVILTYVARMNNQTAAIAMKDSGHQKVSRQTYPNIINLALAKLEAAYTVLLSA